MKGNALSKFARLGGHLLTHPRHVLPYLATVIVRQVETNITTEVVADSQGRFRFPSLRVGPYELRVRRAGFAGRAEALGVPTRFIPHAKPDAILASFGLDAAGKLPETGRKIAQLRIG